MRSNAGMADRGASTCASRVSAQVTTFVLAWLGMTILDCGGVSSGVRISDPKENRLLTGLTRRARA
jgi:hypothetical protein